jgi:para-nitrobenzyl esterase
VADDIFCVAHTVHGAVQGLVSEGIRQFKGVPYGAPTGGANRFAPPKPPSPWAGARECFGYGPSAPQLPSPASLAYGRLIQFDLTVAQGGMGEDCLCLNIWTPGLDHDVRRPVMVSLHGGGFAIGSGSASMYNGAALARMGDVVVVTINHRLGSLGFLDLADVGAPEDDFAFAAVAGVMDLVAALEWVRDNIASFGGDPSNVTIFGQSGGGWKTSILLATPAAKGLFHRAAIQSGSLLRLATRADSAPVAAAFVSALGLSGGDIHKIRDLPWQELLRAQTAIGAHAFAPMLDGRYLTRHPFDPGAPEESADIPLLISTTLDDAGLFSTAFNLGEGDLLAELQSRHGVDSGADLLALYRARWPTKSPYLLLAQIMTDGGFRRFAHLQAERKAARGLAPVWTYLWEWESPGFDGRFGAVHAMDVAATFANEREAILGGGTAQALKMCQGLPLAWINFARTGDPNTLAFPAWPSFSLDRRETLIIGPETRVVADPYPDIRAFWSAMPEPAGVLG